MSGNVKRGRSASGPGARVVVLSVLVSATMMWGASAHAKGSFFLADLNQGLGVPLGFAEGYSPGYAMGLTLGGGGKFRGSPVRLYAIGQFNTSSFSAERTFNGKRRVIDRQITDLNVGARFLWPIAGRHLRVYVDMAFGQAQMDSTATSPDLPGNIRFQDTDSDFALFSALGLQYRFSYYVSVGGKADFAFVFDDDPIDAITAATSDETGQNQVGRLNLYLTGTLHF